jgi:Zn-dependent M28 family amino/carboxypeptidase
MVIGITRKSLTGAVALVSAVAVACQPSASSISPTPSAALPLAADIDTLASRAFGGRQAGTAGDDSTADFLARRYARLGLRAAFHVACGSPPNCRPSYFQRFETPDGVSHNVGVIVDGSDPEHRDEYVVIGAHFDHLGRSPTYSMDRDAGFVLRPGADDNASGTAAVLELAKRFGEHAAKRPLLFVNFDAEELGLVGSRFLLATPPVPKAEMIFMLNLDMVGRLRGDHLYIETERISRVDRAVFDRAAKVVGLRLHFVSDDGRSDHASFAREGIAAAELYTGMHTDYHTAADIAGRINAAGLARVVDFAEHVVRSIADR